MTTARISIIAACCLAVLIAAGVTIGIHIHSAAPQHAAGTPQAQPPPDRSAAAPVTLPERTDHQDHVFREAPHKSLHDHDIYIASLHQADQERQFRARWAFAKAERDRYVRGVVLALRYRPEQWDSLWPDPPREPSYYDLPVPGTLPLPPDRHDK